MKIAINAANLRGLGSSQLGREVVESLCSYKQHCYDLWLPRDWPPISCRDDTVFPCRPGIIPKLFREVVSLPGRIHGENTDAVFSMGDTGIPFCASPQLLLVQQAFLAHDPDTLRFPVPPPLKKKILLMHRYFSLGLRAVDLITVQSQFMKERLSRFWSISTDRIVVQPTPIVLEDVPMTPRKGRVVWLTSDGPHKNLAMLPAIAEKLSSTNLELMITAPRGIFECAQPSAATSSALDKVVFLGRLSHRKTVELVATAEVVFLPSQLESFGMTYYEAMGLGAPVVATDFPFAREALGEAALYCYDELESMVRSILQLTANASLRRRLIENGRQRYQERVPSPKAVAQSYLSMLESIAA